MKARCLTSFFSQKHSGTVGQIIEVKDKQVMDELLASGYVEAIESPSQNQKSASSKGEAPTQKMTAKTKKAVDNHENE
jgi:hypothetical protein